jgi:hypothetical protein
MRGLTKNEGRSRIVMEDLRKNMKSMSGYPVSGSRFEAEIFGYLAGTVPG